ncbi:MAG: DNA polymerase III subunit beta [Chitinophagales bacterium]|jgi:DNA polymerase-3 subunit beta|nr:DNA polymerase III subunit beta [Chitinophagales bacterium]MDC3209627.1 DNA polymerase III subunit beta [Chitinophagales bacterium]|tara:strand:- start:1611 stop:2729 length:1119 start_codon:yes stop_codon:yes gene_type:complete
MRFVVSTTQLLKKLQMISGVISSNTVLPILEDFLFDIKDGKIKVFATDLETSMSTEIEAESKESGKIAIPAKILLDTLKTLPEQPLTFSFDEKNFGIEISSSTGKYKLAGENPEDFPKIPTAEDSSEVEIPSEILGRAITQTLFAVSNDELRPAMTGVYFQLQPDGMTFVSTDASKLVKYKRSDMVSKDPASFIVPKKALQLLKGSLPAEDTQVVVSYNSSNAFFNFSNTKLICRLVDAKYPDYNAVIPVDNDNLLTLNRIDFLNTLKRVSIFSNKTTYQCVLNISGTELKVSSQDLDFSNEAFERINCTYDGDDLEIAFNARFLIEMLGVLETDEIKIELSSATRAGILVPGQVEEGEQLLMLVMPVMLNH